MLLRAIAIVLFAASLARAAPPGLPAVPFAGTVREKGLRTPVAGAEVLILVGERQLGAITDPDGRFTFDAVPVGKYKVAVRASGFVPADTEETFVAGKRLDATYYVEPRQRYRTIVRGQRLAKQTVEQTLYADEIKKIPGTQGDPIKAVQALPGVARAPFGVGQLLVWGSGPLDTRPYVDGVWVPNIYHFGGLRSTVSAELVQSIDFSPGGFGAEYGRGMGGVVGVTTRHPKDNGLHGSVALDLIDGALLIEGPVSKKVSIAVAARRSWIDLFLPLFTSGDFQLSPVYYDYQAALRWRASPRDDVDLLLFGSDDVIKVATKNADPALSARRDSHIFYHRLLARWTRRFAGGATLTVTPSLGLDQPVQFGGGVGNFEFHVDSRMLIYNLRAGVQIPLAKFLRLDAGVDYEGHTWWLDFQGPVVGAPRPGDPMGRMSFGGFTADRVTMHLGGVAPYLAARFSLLGGRLAITPGLRLDGTYAIGYPGTSSEFRRSYVAWEPRLAARWELNRYLALKLALGVYNQPPDPVAFMRRFGNPDGIGLQRAFHYVLGVDVAPTPTLSIEALAFYKDMQAIVARSESASVVLDNGGQGRVVGGQLLVRQRLWRGLFGWISYTASRAERRVRTGGPWQLFEFDQTHILGLVASYEFPRGYQVGARFRYVTGTPTQPVTAWWFDANSDLYVPILGPFASGRLPAFHQLDLRFDKTWTFRLWKLGLYLDVQNVYNAANTETILYAPRPEDCPNRADCQAPVRGLPIFPSLGIRGDF